MPYSKISILAPSSAYHSDVVNFGIGIKNIITDLGIIAWRFRVECWAPDQMPESQVLFDEINIDVGDTKTYPLSFFMPNKDAQIFVWVERLLPYPAPYPSFTYDNAALKDVWLVVAPPPPPPPAEPEFRGFALTEYTRR